MATEYYVRAVGGNDSNDGLSHANAFATIQKGYDTASVGDRINLNGAFVLSSSVNFTTHGNPTSYEEMTSLEGYTATAGDGGIASIDGGGNAIVDGVAQDFVNFRNLKFTNWGASNYAMDLDNNVSWSECEFDGGGVCSLVVAGDNSSIIQNCKAHKIAGTSSDIAIDVRTIRDNYIQMSGGTGGVACSSSVSSFITGNTISLNHVDSWGIKATNITGEIAYNQIFNQAVGTGKGISTETHDGLIILNNIVCGFSGVGGEGINSDATSTILFYGGNKFWNNTDDENLSGRVVNNLGGNVQLASNPFKITGSVDHNDDDFELSSAILAYSGGYWDPDGDFGSRNKNYRDVGALTREYSSDGGGGPPSAFTGFAWTPTGKRIK